MNSRIIKAVAKQEGVTQELVDKINMSMWQLLRLTAESGSLQGVMYPTFGKFAVQARNRIVYADYDPQAEIAKNKENYIRNRERMAQRTADKSRLQEGIKEDATGEASDMQTLPIQ